MIMKTATPHQHHRLLRQGFTLTELLVVIVIIVVLVSISFLGYGKFREYADKANSTRNLSQLQMANTLYANDKNGQYIYLRKFDSDGKRSGFWYQDESLVSYLTGGMTDANGKPARAVQPELLDPKVYRARNSFYHSMAASYGMNDTGLMTAPAPNGRTGHLTGQISDPSNSMAFATATDYRITYNNRYAWKEEDSKTSNGAIAYRHRGAILVAYYDGHVAEMTRADLQEIDKRGGRNHVFWNPKN